MWGTTTTYTYTYDAAGRLTQKADPYQTDYGYDVRGRKITETDALSHSTTFGYDGAGRMTSETPPSGHARVWTYDLAGRLHTAADGLGNTSAYGYDGAGQLERVTLPEGGHFDYTYDDAGLLHTESDPLGRVTTHQYDDSGRPSVTTRPSGRVVTTAYDPAGRVESTSAGVETRSFQYDSSGRVTSATSSAGTLSFGYDERGLMIRSTDGLGDTTYAYDIAQRLTLRAPPASVASTFTYGETRGMPLHLRGPVAVDVATNTAGQWTSLTGHAPGSAKVESRTYDTVGRLTRVGTSTSNETKATYNADGLIDTLTQTESGNPAANVTDLTYDNAGRLSTATLKQGTTVVSATTYGWDGDGNRTSVAVSGQPTVTTTFDLADRPSSSSDGTVFVHDLDGNLTDAGSTSYAYNGFGELSGATVGSTSVDYTRDAWGRVAIRSQGAVPQSLFYDGQSTNLVASRVGSGPLTGVMRDPTGRPLAIAAAGAVAQRVLSTIHGDVAGLFNDNTAGAFTSTTVYDPFGAPTTIGTRPLPLGYQSMLTDPLTGLVDMGSRSYDPDAGRFITADSVMGDLNQAISLNRYLFALANPVNMYDPDGHLPEWLENLADFATGVKDGYRDWALKTLEADIAFLRDPVGAIKGLAQAKSEWEEEHGNSTNLGWACILTPVCDIYDNLKEGNYYEAGYGTGLFGADIVAAGLPTPGIAGVLGALGRVARGLGKAAKGPDLPNPREPEGGKGKETVSEPCDSGNSFAPDTNVLMADGQSTRIANIVVGDEVLATVPESGSSEARAVTAVIVGTGEKHLVDITFDTDGDSGDDTGTVVATEHHPFWVASQHRWREAVDLRADDLVRTSSGRLLAVVATTRHTERTIVYNLTVDTAHTYYVLAGQTSVLVHNCGGPIRVSPAAQDWGTKGAHIHVGNHEVRIFPDGQGGIGAEPIRLSNGTATAGDVQIALQQIRADPALRADLIRQAKSAMESMNAGEWGMATNRAAEMNFLIKALEKMG